MKANSLTTAVGPLMLFNHLTPRKTDFLHNLMELGTYVLRQSLANNVVVKRFMDWYLSGSHSVICLKELAVSDVNYQPNHFQ